MTTANDFSQPWLDFMKTAQSAWTPPTNPWANFGAATSAATMTPPGMQPLLDMLQATVKAVGSGALSPQQLLTEMGKTMTPLMQQFLQGQQPWQTLWKSAAPGLSTDGVLDWLKDLPMGQGMSWANELAPLGAAREYLRQGQEHSVKAAQLPAKMAAFAQVMQRFPELLQEKLQERVQQLTQSEKTLDSTRAVLDLWIDAAEDAFAEIAHSKDYGKAQGELSNLLMELKIERQANLDQCLEFIGLPSRRELDTTHRRMAALRRENRQLKSELAALQADVAALKKRPATSRSRSTTKKATTGAQA